MTGPRRGPWPSAATGPWPALVLALALASLPLAAQPRAVPTPSPAAAAVIGTVLHGVTGEPVAAADVALLVPGPTGQLSEVGRQPADSTGHFAFAGPFVEPGQPFVLVAFYRGVPYPSQTLEVGQQSAVLLEVYDPTGRADHIAIDGHHLFLAVDVQGVDAAHLVQVVNRGDSAYVGRGTGAERRVTEFRLPPGLTALQNHNSALLRAGDGHYFDSQPLVPGTTQIAFSFRLPPAALKGGYVHRVVYPTRSFDVYVQPTDVTPGAPFEDLGTIDVHGRLYRHLQVGDLVPGQVLRLPLPIEPPRRWLVKWLVLALGLVAAAAAFLVGRGVGPASCPNRGEPARRQLEASRRAVLEALAGLDPQDEARREELMREAVAIYQGLEREP